MAAPTADPDPRALRRLARLYGVQPSYRALDGAVRTAAPHALLLALRAVGAPVHRLADVSDALRLRRRQLWAGPLEPVAVAWMGAPAGVSLRVPAHAAGAITCRLVLENGEERQWRCMLHELPVSARALVEGVQYVRRRLPLAGPLPPGYHRLALESAEFGTWDAAPGTLEALVIASPPRAYDPYRDPPRRTWGAFLPTYAIRSTRNWGCGDLTDLSELGRWIGARGGALVGTLPLLASYLGHGNEPYHPSPYAPVSRLFWNELYLDVTRVPELEACEPARRLAESRACRAGLRALREEPIVDYRGVSALKREVLAHLARAFFQHCSGARREAFEQFLERRPELQAYAAFRAAVVRHGSRWRGWARPLRNGTASLGAYDDEVRRYHLYVQWLAEEQMGALAQELAHRGVRLYLDLPLGVHPDGFDVWWERERFATGASAGAPPDPFFSRGQDWDFPPLHPERERESGYHYTIRCLRHHLRHPGLLRIDHVMSLHRLFWIPRGADPTEGVYVRYHAEELYAILCLESHRHRAAIAGEDLGTVPAAVPTAMERRGLYRMFVVPFELSLRPEKPLPEPPAASLASLNTHDMPPFRAFWEGLDIADRTASGWLDEAGERREREQRDALRRTLLAVLRQGGWLQHDATAPSVLPAALRYLAQSPARLLLVNLEDLWGETRPQNMPGTGQARPNWRRKAGYTLERMQETPALARLLDEIQRLRQEHAP